MKSLRKWFLAASIVAGLVFGCRFLLLVLAAGPTSRVLPDGSRLRLVAVTFSPNTVARVKGVTGWRRGLCRLMPARVRWELGWRAEGGSLALREEPGQTNLMVAFVAQLKNGNSLIAPQLQIRDEAGNWVEVGWNHGGWRLSDGKRGLEDLEAWMVPIFPRRSRQLDLRVVGQSGVGTNFFADFTVPNPALQDYPAWPAARLPSTQTNGDLAVTLRGLQVSYPAAGAAQPAMATATMSLAGHGAGDSGTWAIAGIRVSDETGNIWDGFPFRPLGRERTELTSPLPPGLPWPGESAWKLRMELSPAARFAPEDVVTWAGVPVPAETNTVVLNWTTNLAGASLKLIALSGRSATPPENVNHAVTIGRVFFWVEAVVSPGAPPVRLRLCSVVDEAGRGVGKIGSNPEPGGFKAMYGLTPAAEARSLTITFALPASRFVEFRARPEFPARTAKP